MNTALTTFDGYPRDDLDIAQSAFPPYDQYFAQPLTMAKQYGRQDLA